MRVTGTDPPKPVREFSQCNFDTTLMKAIATAGFERPTPIQCQALPTALSGRDVIGISQTGSGKTVAYLWPMIVHMMDQPEVQRGEGPIALVLAPTRELAQQIHTEAKKFCKLYGIR